VNLKTARLAQGLTQEELGARAGIGQAAIAMLERLKYPNPKWTTAARLSLALDVEPWDLFGRPRRARRPRRERPA